MDTITEEASEKKSTWEHVKGLTKEAVERLKGAETMALEAIEKTKVEVVDEIRASNETIKTTVQSATELTQKAQQNLTKAEEGTTHITTLGTEGQKLVDSLKAKSEEAKNSQAQIQASLKAVENSDAEGKAHLKEIVTTKAEMKNQFDGINQFYSEIGERKTELLDLKNKTATDFSKLNENFSATMDENKNRTEKLISDNEKIADEIRSHLQRAVGASLFSAFNKRKETIVFSKWAWAILFAASIIGAFFWVNSMIAGLNGSLDMAFVIRTVFGALIGYFVYFCSKQYDRERRAEEEYAFKSAVSVSLKPFQDLLLESKDKEIDSEFVKQLMNEIFDNPVNRLFLESKTIAKLQLNAKGLNGEHSVEPQELKK